MQYRDVVKKSIVSFMDGKMPEKTAEVKGGELRYTPEYFDDLEKRILGDKAASDNENKEETDGDS